MLNIFIVIMLLILLFTLSWCINKFLYKKSKNNILIIAVIIWIIIFIINLFSTLLNIPLVIGFNVTSRFDGGINGKYISLGYAIEVEGHNLVGDSNYNIYFTDIFK